MPQKQKQINGFSLFVEQRVKPTLERGNGGRYVSMQEAISHAVPLWDQLSPEQKNEWKERAKQHKVTPEFQMEKQLHKERYYRQRALLSDPMAPRMNKKSKARSSASRVDELERMSCRYYDDVDEETFREKRERDRGNMEMHFLWKTPQDDNARREWLHGRRFNILTAAAYCETREHEFPPSEMSVVTFSFKEGVTYTKHWLIDHVIPEWTDPDAYDAAQQNEVNTGIPADGMRSTLLRQYGITDDYDNILRTLMDKFKDEKHVFVHRRDWNTVMGCLHWLKDNSNLDGREIDRLSEDLFVCIEDLFLVISKFLNFDVTSTLIADVDEKLSAPWETYMTNEHVLCQFHYSRVRSHPHQAQRCSLACARRYTFSLFDMANTGTGAGNNGNYFPDMRLGPNHFPPIQQSFANGTLTTQANHENATDALDDFASGFQSSGDGFAVRPVGFNRPSQPPPTAQAVIEDVRSDDSFDDEIDEELGYSSARYLPAALQTISFGDDDDDDIPQRIPPTRSIPNPVVQPPRPPPSAFSGFGNVRPMASALNNSAQSAGAFAGRSAQNVQNVQDWVTTHKGVDNAQLNSNSSSVAGSSRITSPIEPRQPKPASKPKTLPPSVLNRLSAASRAASTTSAASSSTRPSLLGPSADQSQRQAPRGLGRGMRVDEDDVAKFF